MSTAFIYARISQDRDGTSTAPERQIASARELAEREGFTVAGIYTDRDLSASKASVTRPDFERLLVDAQREGATVFAWNQDRLFRQSMDAERILLAEIPVRTVLGDTGLMSDAAARLMVRVKAAIGTHETELMAVRLRAQAREAAELGRAHPGGRRAFGHEAGAELEHPTEAPIVRELVRRVLAGERLSELVRELRDRGVTATTGAPFTLSSVRYVLTCARIAGARELEGELVVSGAIAPLITLEELAAVRSTLAARNGSRSPSSRARRHLLSGALYCGKCGSRMVADGAKDWRRYRCPSPRGVVHSGCGGVSMAAEPLEAFVAEEVLERMEASSRELAEALELEEQSPVSAALEELRAVDALRGELLEDRADSLIDRAEFRRLAERLEERRAIAERAIASHERSSSRAALPVGAAAREAWSSGALHYRREVLTAMVERVTVEPREGGRGGRFDSSRIHVSWSA